MAEFKAQWMHHGLSTENGMSPIQLYTTGILASANSDHTAINSILHHDLSNYGVDPNGPFPSATDYQISIPESSIELSDEQQQYLSSRFNQRTYYEDNGKNEYSQGVNILQFMLRE